MSPPSRSLLEVPLASWQWKEPLMRFFLILIIFMWGLVLEVCGGQPNYTPELQYLMSFGSFIVALVVGILAQATLAHMFSYIQGYFLIKEQGIPLQAIMSGEQTPGRILAACLVIFRQNKKQGHSSFFHIISYAGILLVYILAVSTSAYAASKLGAPYVFYNAPVKWVQAPTQGIKSSLLNSFLPENFLGGINQIQFDSLAEWVDKTRGGIYEVPFMPQTWTTFGNATQGGHLRDKDGLIKWNLEMDLKNAAMRYLTAQCDANLNPPCNNNQVISGTTVYIMGGRENKTISWIICNLPFNLDSVQLDCNITLRQGNFPKITIGYPETNPRDEYLAEVLLRKNELTDLNELIDELFSAMEETLSIPNHENGLISNNVVNQLVTGWDCNKGNKTCAQLQGASAAVRYTGALLEAASLMFPVDNSINLDDFIENSTSTGSVTATHKVCIGGENPLLSIGLMISVPLVMIIVELLPLLLNNKVWWLASDIGYKHIALIRSVEDCKIGLEPTIRPDETPCQTIVRFNTEDDVHFGLSIRKDV